MTSTLFSATNPSPNSIFDLPVELHWHIKNFVGPIGAKALFRTCHAFKAIYGKDQIWKQWLKTKYQIKIFEGNLPRIFAEDKLSIATEEMLSFKTRKKYDIKINHAKFFKKLPLVIYLAKSEFITIEDLPFWSGSELQELYYLLTTSRGLSRLVKDKKIPIECVLDIPKDQLYKFTDCIFAYLIDKDGFSIEEALATSIEQFYNLRDFKIYTLVLNNRSLISDFLKLSANDAEYLKDDFVIKLITEDHQTIQQVSKFSKIPPKIFKNKNIRSLILTDKLFLNEVLNLSENQITNLEFEPIQMLITERALSAKDAASIPEDQVHKFTSFEVRRLIKGGHLTVENVFSLSETQLRKLEGPTIGSLIESGLPWQQVINIPDDQIYKFKSTDVQKLIVGNFLSIEETIALSGAEMNRLKYPYLISLILRKSVTVREVLEASEERRLAWFKECIAP